MKYRIFALTLLVLLTFSACGRKDEEKRYTSVLEGIKTAVSSQTGGTLLQLMVTEGDVIGVGDTVAILDDRELSYQMEQLDAAKHELDTQESVSRTQIAQLETDAEYLRQRRTRTQNLYDSAVIARQNLDDILNQESKLQSQLRAATKSLDLLQAKREQLLAQEKTLRKRQADMVVRSAVKGRIDTAYYRQGELVPPLGQILQVIDTQSLTAKIYVSENELARIKTGSSVKVISSGSSKMTTGTVTRIADKAEFTPKAILTPDNRSSMVYAVEITIRDNIGYLKDGMPVDIILP